MKKILLTMVLMLSMFMTSFAQNYITFTGTSYAIANVNQITGRYTWSEWQRCTVRIIFDLQNDIIYIQSNAPQKYVVISSGNDYTDSDGGSQVKYQVIDQDGDRGTLRLRMERNGNSQIYVDFNNVAWCYNVVRN